MLPPNQQSFVYLYGTPLYPVFHVSLQNRAKTKDLKSSRHEDRPLPIPFFQPKPPSPPRIHDDGLLQSQTCSTQTPKRNRPTPDRRNLQPIRPSINRGPIHIKAYGTALLPIPDTLPIKIHTITKNRHSLPDLSSTRATPASKLGCLD